MTGACNTLIIVRASITRKIRPQKIEILERDNSLSPVCQFLTYRNENVNLKKLIYYPNFLYSVPVKTNVPIPITRIMVG
jgi:hypothetical protein